MKARTWVLLGVFCCATLVSLGGCPLIQTRTNNQGGGNLITAGVKLASDNVGGLTADEIQIVTDFAISQQSLPIEALTDAQAGAIVTFLDDNNVNTVEDVQNLINDPTSIVISEEVLAVLQSEEVSEILEQLIGVNLP